MSTPRPSLRIAAALALVGALTLPACKKDGDSNVPGAGDAQAGGTLLRYKAGAFKLKQDAKIDFKISGSGMAGNMKADLTGLLDVSDAGGKLKIAYSIADLRDFDISESLKPKPKEGQPPVDVKARLLAAKGARIVDLRGETDDAATKALPENAKKEGDESGDGGLAASFLGLPPGLPEQALAPNTPVKVKKQEPEKLPFGEIEMDIETTYTLLKVDESSGKRLAEIKFESESSGANEINQGGRSFMISIDTSTEGTLVFDLDAQLPVRSSLKTTQAVSFGSEGSQEIQINLDSSYAPA